MTFSVSGSYCKHFKRVLRCACVCPALHTIQNSSSLKLLVQPLLNKHCTKWFRSLIGKNHPRKGTRIALTQTTTWRIIYR